MSAAKELMDVYQEQQLTAIEIALAAKVLSCCPYHEIVYDPLAGNIVEAYKLGNYRLSAGQLGGVFSNSREMTDAVKAVVEEAAMECWACAKERDA